MKKILSLFIAFALLTFVASPSLAVVNSVTPSTNDINRTKGWAHVNQISKGIGTMELKFISTRTFWSCFEYRIDNEPNTVVGSNQNPLITDGRWKQVCVNNSESTKTLLANDYVDIRMVYGAEGDERFDWTRFDVLPNPDLDNDGVLNEDDKCEDTTVDGSWDEGLGTNRWQVMKDGDGVLGWYQNKPGKKGVKATEYGQDMEYTYGCNGHQILEMLAPLGESMKGHWKFGLSSSVLEEFHLDMNDGKLDGWYFVETLKVDSKVPAGIDSKYVLETDVDYILKAYGTFTYNTAGDWADAEWYLKNGIAVKGDIEGSKPYVLDVSINGYSKNQDWGVYNSEHKYEMTYTGEGLKAHFSIYDSASSDNNGSITVDIYAHI